MERDIGQQDKIYYQNDDDDNYFEKSKICLYIHFDILQMNVLMINF